MKGKIRLILERGKSFGAGFWAKVKQASPAQRLVAGYIGGIMILALIFYLVFPSFNYNGEIDITPINPVDQKSNDIPERSRDRVLWDACPESAVTLSGKKEQSAAESDEFKIIMPLKGKIIYGFDEIKRNSDNDTVCLHDGLEIQGTAGQPVVAAASGKVIAAEKLVLQNGQFSWVIMEHKNNYYTVYEGLDALTVTVDDYVDAGQQIGTLGKVNFYSQDCLHFALYKDGYSAPFYDEKAGGGIPEDPQQYIK